MNLAEFLAADIKNIPNFYFNHPNCRLMEGRLELLSKSSTFDQRDSTLRRNGEVLGKLCSGRISGFGAWFPKSPYLIEATFLVKNPLKKEGLRIGGEWLGPQNALILHSETLFAGTIRDNGIVVTRPILRDYQTPLKDWLCDLLARTQTTQSLAT